MSCLTAGRARRRPEEGSGRPGPGPGRGRRGKGTRREQDGRESTGQLPDPPTPPHRPTRPTHTHTPPARRGDLRPTRNDTPPHPPIPEAATPPPQPAPTHHSLILQPGRNKWQQRGCQQPDHAPAGPLTWDDVEAGRQAFATSSATPDATSGATLYATRGATGLPPTAHIHYYLKSWGRRPLGTAEVQRRGRRGDPDL